MAVYALRSFSSVDLPPAFAVSSIGVGRTNYPSVQTISGTSFDTSRGARVLPSGIAIAHTGQYFDDTLQGLEDQYVPLRQLVGTRGYLIRERLRDGDLQRTMARFVAEESQAVWNEVLELSVRLSFIKESPVWYADTLTTTTETLAMTAGTASQTIDVLNAFADEGAPVSNVKVTVVAGSANITSLQIAGTHTDLGLLTDWTYTGTILAGNTFILDNGAKSITNNGVAAYTSAFTFNSGHKLSDWLWLEAGDTAYVVTYTGGGVGSTVSFQFYAGYP